VINCGIIGYGKMGRIREDCIQRAPNARLTHIHDPFASTPCPTACESWQEILDDPRLDAVFVCTPNAMNRQLTLAALNAGKHVFCEKPPCFTAPDLDAVITAERQSGRTLMYGFNHRHHASIMHMKQVISEDQMGRILWMRGRYGKEVSPVYFSGWRADKVQSGGGILLDQGIHMLDLMMYLGGNFDDVQAMLSNTFWQMDGLEDNVFINMRSRESGISASVHSTMTQWGFIFSLEVCLEGGLLCLNGLKTTSGAYGQEQLTIRHCRQPDSAMETIHYLEDRSWQCETDHFLGCIESGSPIRMGTSTDALQVMTLIDRIYAQWTH